MTLEVVDCASTSTKLSGAKVELGVVELGLTDAAGRFHAVLDDFNDPAIFKISKADYVKDNFKFEKAAHAGTVQTVCLTNPATIPDGHDPNVPGESGGQEFDGGGCFVVTATTGSPVSLEVNSLRALRDRVSVASQLGARLIEAVYDEYARFSPAIAAELYQDATARGTVLASIVRPLFAWYTLAGTLGFEGDDRHACRQAAQDVVDACPRDLDGRAIVGLLEALRSGAPLPPALPPMLLGLASQVADFRFASWAILEPLIRAWRSATDDLDVVEEVAQWLAGAPLERLARPVDAASLDAELAVVADFLAFAPSKRTVVGERLLSAWPDAAGALQRAGFIRQTVRAGECQSS
jgi:hypothetical protein